MKIGRAGPLFEYRRLLVGLAGVAIGAGAGLYLGGPSIGAAAVGGLIGFLFGWRFAEAWFPRDSPSGAGSTFPHAVIGLILAIGAWVAVGLIWIWVLTRPSGTFADQGGMLITFLILPATFFLWLIGGPTASASARSALRQVQAGTRPPGDVAIARRAILISQLMTLFLILLVVWIIYK